MSRTRPKRKDVLEWFDLDGDEAFVPLSQVPGGYYMFGPPPGKGSTSARVAVGPFGNQAEMAANLEECEGPSEGEGIAIIMGGRVVAWRDVVPTYSWPALDMIPKHLVG